MMSSRASASSILDCSTCSLYAEGAFDAMPHVVIFGKLDGIVPDYAWRVMYAWYRQMYVYIRLHGALGQRRPVRRATRQGGLSSPWIFNVFYWDLSDTISKSDRGISPRGETYSVFCYADDLLIASTTSTGLQALIDLCDSYNISQHGLRCNPQKTSYITVGKHRLVSQPQWTIKGRQLKVTDTFSYLGAVLGDGGSAEHVNQTIRAAKNAHKIAAGSRSSCQWAVPIGRNGCVFPWSPAMPKLRGRMPSTFQQLNYVPLTRHTLT